MKHPVGIIGLGMIGERMLEEFLRHPSFEVAACWDLNPQVYKHVKAKFPEAPVVSHSKQVFERKDIELFYIATPPITHVDYGLQIISLGKALFMEKPLSIHLSEAQKLVESAEVNKIQTAMNFGYGAGPVVNALEEAIADRQLGNIKSIEIRYEFPSWPLPNQLSAAGWITNKNTGGMVREMFSHHVYLIHRLFSLLSVVSAVISYPDKKDAAEEFVLASLVTEDGIPVRFMGGIGSSQTPRNSDFTVNGEKGSLRISEGMQLLAARNGAWEDVGLDTHRTSMEVRLDQLAILLKYGSSRLPTLRDGFKVQQVIENLLSIGN